MDIKHVLSRNPLLPAYDTVCPVPAAPTAASAWAEFAGGVHRDRPYRRRLQLRQRTAPPPDVRRVPSPWPTGR